MAHTQHKNTLPMTAASAFLAGVVLEGVAAVDEKVRTAVANTSAEILGLSIATVPTYGAPAAVLVGGVGKAIAAASFGAFTRVTVASTNGAIGPVTPSGVASGPSAMQAARFSVGVALKSAAAGDIVPVFVRIEEVI